MMYPINVTIVRVAGAATMAIIPIQIVGNSFTLIPSDSLSIVMSGPARTTRLDSSQYVCTELSGADPPFGDVSGYS